MSPELTESRVRELAREEIRAAAQPVASKPVAGEWTEDNPFGDKAWRRLIDGRTMLIVDNWRPNIGCAWRVFQRGGRLTMSGAELASNGGDAYQNARDAADAWARDNAHLLDWTLPPAPVQPVAPREECDHAACLSAHPGRSRCCACEEPLSGAPAVPQPAPNDNGDTSLAYACGAVAAAAVAIVDPTQPSDMVFRVVRDALAANGATHPAPDSWHDAVTWIEGWGTEQPAPSATVDEVIDAVRYNGRGMVVTDRLRAALSTLSPAQLRGMVDAIGGGK